MSNEYDSVVTHVAGNVLVLEGRYMRQRCGWCGAILIDEDLSRCSSPDGGGIGSWDVNVLVDVHGLNPIHSSLNKSKTLPDTFCGNEEIGLNDAK